MTVSIDEIVSLAGGNSALGRQLGISPQSISRWKRYGYVPIERVPPVEKITGIPRHIIRPDRPDLFPPPNEVAA